MRLPVVEAYRLDEFFRLSAVFPCGIKLLAALDCAAINAEDGVYRFLIESCEKRLQFAVPLAPFVQGRVRQKNFLASEASPRTRMISPPFFAIS